MTALWTQIGGAVRRMLIAWSGAPCPKRFADDCRQIVQQHSGHKAHRQLDLLTNEILTSLGYGEGIAIFEAAVCDWHRDGLPYPADESAQ